MSGTAAAPRDEWPVLAAVAAGGAAGASARYGAALLWPAGPGGFPWTTFAVNAVGCALIGVLMALIAAARKPVHRLVRPFLGTGVLGGFTTFSTYAVDTERLLDGGHLGTGLLHLALTPLTALAAVAAATVATRRVLAARREAGGR
ncbi:FluC/FEX family fluoride channel [Streptomyces alboflavus]|uniref:FluC/FEX family fluoride channel n=1 Tax=Streptomyces alboflavus TaxID=67267 RepID=UPI0036B8DB14